MSTLKKQSKTKIEGVTSTGFKYAILTECVNDYELLELIGAMEDNQLIFPKLLEKLLGKEQKQALIEHLRLESGTVPINAVMDAVAEIFQHDALKN